MTVTELLGRLEHFMQAANPGYGREVAMAYLSELHGDGSGVLRVDFASTQNETEEQVLFSRIFMSSRSWEFKTIDELLKLLDAPDLLIVKHPELGGAE